MVYKKGGKEGRKHAEFERSPVERIGLLNAKYPRLLFIVDVVQFHRISDCVYHFQLFLT